MRNLMFIAILGAIVYFAARPALEKKAEQMVDHAVSIGSRGHFEEGIKELDRVDKYLGWTEAAERIDGERAYLQQQLGYVARADRHQEMLTKMGQNPQVPRVDEETREQLQDSAREFEALKAVPIVPQVPPAPYRRP